MKQLIAITTVAAALLLGGTAHAGWYLMTPPTGGAQTYWTAPLSHWTIGDSFDSSYECYRMLSELRAESEKAYKKANSGKVSDCSARIGTCTDAELELLTQKSVSEQFDDSHCIASDDPRLSAKPNSD
jgi:hypothetical protein